LPDYEEKHNEVPIEIEEVEKPIDVTVFPLTKNHDEKHNESLLNIAAIMEPPSRLSIKQVLPS